MPVHPSVSDTEGETGEPLTVHVLIVDDQAAFRRAAGRVIARLPGFDIVAEAQTGEASVAIARLLRPDLVLMDIHLPGIDGTEAARRILAEAAATEKAPIVFLLSTYEADDFVAQTIACGASSYLAKAEFGPNTLEAAWAAASAERPEIT